MKRVLFLILMMVTRAALASAPEKPTKKGEEYLEPAGTIWGNVYVCTAADADYVVGTVPGGSTPLCLPFGSQVMMESIGGNFEITWSQTASITYDNASGGADACDVGDANGPDGVGACVRLKNGVPKNEVPTIDQLMRTTIGRRTGVCSVPRKPWPESTDIVYPACYAASECQNSLGSGASSTCDTTNGSGQQKLIANQGCAMLIYQCDTAGALVYIGVQE